MTWQSFDTGGAISQFLLGVTISVPGGTAEDVKTKANGLFKKQDVRQALKLYLAGIEKCGPGSTPATDSDVTGSDVPPPDAATNQSTRSPEQDFLRTVLFSNASNCLFELGFYTESQTFARESMRIGGGLTTDPVAAAALQAKASALIEKNANRQVKCTMYGGRLVERAAAGATGGPTKSNTQANGSVTTAEPGDANGAPRTKLLSPDAFPRYRSQRLTQGLEFYAGHDEGTSFLRKKQDCWDVAVERERLAEKTAKTAEKRSSVNKAENLSQSQKKKLKKKTKGDGGSSRASEGGDSDSNWCIDAIHAVDKYMSWPLLSRDPSDRDFTVFFGGVGDMRHFMVSIIDLYGQVSRRTTEAGKDTDRNLSDSHSSNAGGTREIVPKHCRFILNDYLPLTLARDVLILHLAQQLARKCGDDDYAYYTEEERSEMGVTGGNTHNANSHNRSTTNNSSTNTSTTTTNDNNNENDTSTNTTLSRDSPRLVASALQYLYVGGVLPPIVVNGVIIPALEELVQGAEPAVDVSHNREPATAESADPELKMSENSPKKSLQDLVGKSIGFAPGTIEQLVPVWRKWLRFWQGKPDKRYQWVTNRVMKKAANKVAFRGPMPSAMDQMLDSTPDMREIYQEKEDSASEILSSDWEKYVCQKTQALLPPGIVRGRYKSGGFSEVDVTAWAESENLARAMDGSRSRVDPDEHFQTALASHRYTSYMGKSGPRPARANKAKKQMPEMVQSCWDDCRTEWGDHNEWVPNITVIDPDYFAAGGRKPEAGAIGLCPDDIIGQLYSREHALRMEFNKQSEIDNQKLRVKHPASLMTFPKRRVEIFDWSAHFFLTLGRALLMFRDGAVERVKREVAATEGVNEGASSLEESESTIGATHAERSNALYSISTSAVIDCRDLYTAIGTYRGISKAWMSNCPDYVGTMPMYIDAALALKKSKNKNPTNRTGMSGRIESNVMLHTGCWPDSDGSSYFFSTSYFTPEEGRKLFGVRYIAPEPHPAGIPGPYGDLRWEHDIDKSTMLTPSAPSTMQKQEAQELLRSILLHLLMPALTTWESPTPSMFAAQPATAAQWFRLVATLVDHFRFPAHWVTEILEEVFESNGLRGTKAALPKKNPPEVHGRFSKSTRFVDLSFCMSELKVMATVFGEGVVETDGDSSGGVKDSDNTICSEGSGECSDGSSPALNDKTAFPITPLRTPSGGAPTLLTAATPAGKVAEAKGVEDSDASDASTQHSQLGPKSWFRPLSHESTVGARSLRLPSLSTIRKYKIGNLLLSDYTTTGYPRKGIVGMALVELGELGDKEAKVLSDPKAHMARTGMSEAHLSDESAIDIRKLLEERLVKSGADTVDRDDGYIPDYIRQNPELAEIAMVNPTGPRAFLTERHLWRTNLLYDCKQILSAVTFDSAQKSAEFFLDDATYRELTSSKRVYCVVFDYFSWWTFSVPKLLSAANVVEG